MNPTTDFFQLRSWMPVSVDSEFPIQNLPLGIFKHSDGSGRACSVIGTQIIDLYELARTGLLKFENLNPEIFQQPVLNNFLELGSVVRIALRNRLIELLEISNGDLRDAIHLHSGIFKELKSVSLMMPVKVGDYTDFYSSLDHARNVGTMLRGAEDALMPNWKHLPVAYHGRSSSIVISGTPVKRPKGQTKAADQNVPVFGPTNALDFELEMATVIGKKSDLGTSISTEEAEDYIAGFLLFNDWSARDIQGWEYVPLGPFLSKNFISSVSPWLVSPEALAPFRTKGPVQDVAVLPYLEFQGEKNYDISLEVILKTKEGAETSITNSNVKYLYWNVNQQIAHHTVNGCNLNVGDLMASGTISGPEKESRGCLLELTWRGKEPVTLSDGTQRRFLEDGDTVIMKGVAVKNNIRIGFGEVRGTVIA